MSRPMATHSSVVAWIMLALVGLNASLELAELGDIDDSTPVELSDDVRSLRESLWGLPGNITQANSTPVSKRVFEKRYDGQLGQRVGTFIEVTASSESVTIDKNLGLNASAETPVDERTIFTRNLMLKMSQGLFPRFIGSTEYFTGANYPMSKPPSERQFDGTPWPGNGQTGTVPARFSSIFSMSTVSFMEGNATKSEIYVADNLLKLAGTGETVPDKGSIRVINVQTGSVSTEANAVPDGTVFSVSAQSIDINNTGTRSTMVYSVVQGKGFHRWDAADGLVQLSVPGWSVVNASNVTQVAAWTPRDLTDSCLASDHAFVYLHWNGKLFDLETAKCATPETCVFRVLSDYKHFTKGVRMHCGIHSQNQTLNFFTSQGDSVVSSDLMTARDPSSTEAPQRVVATANGGTMDGGAPEFRDFTGLAVYAPAWLAEDEPYVMVSSDGQLRAINSKTGFASSIGPTSRGPVAVVGKNAYTGEKLVYKSNLVYSVPCRDVNQILARAVIEWQLPASSKTNVAIERVNVTLNDAGSQTKWDVVAMKKSSKVKQGFMEKAMVCMERPKVANATLSRTYAQCCMTKFSKQMEGRGAWPEQLSETQIY